MFDFMRSDFSIRHLSLIIEMAILKASIFAYRVKPIEAKMFGLVEGSYMSSNEFDEATGYGR